MKTKLWTLQPKKQRWRKIGLTAALIVFMGAGLLFGTIKMIDATQTEVPACMERTKPDCIKDMPKPICPPQHQRVPCPLNTAE